MNSILAKVGLIAIFLLILYLIQKVGEYFPTKRMNRREDDGAYAIDDKVYKAARAFAQGISFDEIRNILINCVDFDEEDIQKIISMAYPHTTDADGGYSAFIKAVNKVTGENTYRETDY